MMAVRPILLLGSQMAVGGAQGLLLAQADWLHRQGYPVTAAFLYDRDGLHMRWKTSRPYPVVDLGFFPAQSGKTSNRLQVLGGIVRLWQLLRSQPYGAIETFTHHSNLIGCPLAWLVGIPVRVATHHGHIDGMSTALEWVHASLVNLGIASWLVAVSQDIQHRALKEGVRPNRLVTIPNGVEPVQPDPIRSAELRRGLPGDPSGPLLLAVGRLTFQKGHSILLKALPAILQRFPNARLALVGDGPLRSELENEAQRLGIASQVLFLGTRSDVAEWMSIADVFVLPSRSEGLPLALLEAMSAGCAIVSARVAGVGEVLSEGQVGWIVPTEDDQALADAITHLLADPQLRQRLGLGAKQRFEQNYRFEKMAQQYLNLLNPDTGKKQVRSIHEKHIS